MRVWDKVINKKNGAEGMIVAINEELQTIDVRCEEVTKTLTMAQFERYWDTTYAIKKPGPKPKVRHGPKPKPKKPGPKPKPNPGGVKKSHRSKYEVGTYARVKDTHTPNTKKYRKELDLDEILEYIKDIAINQYGMSYEVVNDRDFKFRTPYDGPGNKNGYSAQCTLMVRKYIQQVNIYTKALWLTDDIKRNPRMLAQKYYYDKAMRIPNFNEATQEFIANLIKCVNENYVPVERPKTYNRKRGKKYSTTYRENLQAKRQKDRAEIRELKAKLAELTEKEN